MPLLTMRVGKSENERDREDEKEGRWCIFCIFIFFLKTKLKWIFLACDWWSGGYEELKINSGCK